MRVLQEMIDPENDPRGPELRFARRMWFMRILGLGLGVLPIGVVLYEQGAPPIAWIALIANGYLWPHVAYALSRHSRDTRATEFRNLMADSAFGGAWIAVMGFNLVPSALLGFPVDLHSSMAVIVACVPFLFAYPMAISTASHALARRVVQQNRQLERLNRIDVLTGLPTGGTGTRRSAPNWRVSCARAGRRCCC